LLLARALSARGLPAMDAGISPESYTGPIVRFAPEVLILADAAEMGEPPGTLALLPSTAIAETGASTHDFALSLIVTFLTAQHPMEVVVLAMQPGSRDLGAAPTPALTSALRAAEAFFG
jgi:hydrogenase 3 maturation protease